MSSQEVKYYAKFNGITGDVQVANFSGCFNVSYFREGKISNSFQAINNGQSFRGVPSLGSMRLAIRNASATVGSTFLKNMLNASPITTISIYESTMLNGTETITYEIDIQNAHLTYYNRDPSDGGEVELEIGAFSQVAYTFVEVGQDGSVQTQSVVNYDLVKNVVS